MSAHDEKSSTRMNAENKGGGQQYLTNGAGDQSVASDKATIVHNQQFNYVGMSNLGHGKKEPGSSIVPFFPNIWHPEGRSHSEIINWLTTRANQPLMNVSRLRRHLVTQVTESTGEWILSEKKFVEWHDTSTSSRVLWMHGIFGSGKTMLVSFIIQSIKKKIEVGDGTACVYFFYQENEHHYVSVACMWITLLIQLLDIDAVEISNNLKARFINVLQKPAPIDSSEYFELFIAQATAFKRVYLVIDALDSPRNVLRSGSLKDIADSLGKLPSHIRVLFTSTDNYIGKEVRGHQEIVIAPKKEDVIAYVKKQIADNSTLSELLAESGRQEKVIQDITDKTLSSGMFLSAKLYMDHLRKQSTVADISEALQSLPDALLEALRASAQRMAQRIKENDNGQSLLIKHILIWVTHARVELNIEQIQDSFAVQRSEGKCYQDHLPLKEVVKRAFAGLVTMDPEKKTLSLVHESLKQHLEQEGIIPKDADLKIAETCLYFLINACNAKSKSPLLRYAAKYCWEHLNGKEQNMDKNMAVLAMQFLEDKHNLTKAFQALDDMDGVLFDSMTGWHAAVHFDLFFWADRLTHVNINSQCSDGQTALHWAVRHDRQKFLELLIRKSANLNIGDQANDTPLHKALATNNIKMAKMLIRGNARLDIRNKNGVSPLEFVIQHGPTSIATMMIESQKNVDAEVFEDWTLLRLVLSYGLNIRSDTPKESPQTNRGEWNQHDSAAAGDHRQTLTNVLLKLGVHLNRPSTKTKWTPLVFAASKGDLHMMRRLLTYEKPARVDVQDQEGKTSLWWAIHSEMTGAIQLLSEHGANVNETYGDGSTPLYEAVKKKSRKLVHLLINLGADVNKRPARASSLLIEAIKLQDRDTAWLLLNAGARPDEQDDGGKSALFYAIEKGDKALVWLLTSKGVIAKLSSPLNTNNGSNKETQRLIELALKRNDHSTAWLLCEHGANINTVIDDKNRTLLHWAVDEGNLRAVHLLLHYGASIVVQEKAGLTPLHYGVLRNRADIVALLAAHAPESSSLNVTDGRGNTALILTTILKNIDILRVLVLNGASCNAVGLKRRTALHHAAWQGFREGLRTLLDGGGNPKAVDEEGFAPIHHAVCGQNADMAVVKMLVAAGANLEAQDKNGQTPLMLAAQQGNMELVTYLVDHEADIEAQDRFGRTAFDYAERHTRIHKLLWAIYKRDYHIRPRDE